MYLTSVFFFSKHCFNNIWNTFLDPFEQETFQALAYHHHPQNLQAVLLQHVFNSWTYWLWETFLLLIYSILQVKNAQLIHFFFLHRPRIHLPKWYILLKFLIFLAEVFSSSNAVFSVGARYCDDISFLLGFHHDVDRLRTGNEVTPLRK